MKYFLGGPGLRIGGSQGFFCLVTMCWLLYQNKPFINQILNSVCVKFSLVPACQFVYLGRVLFKQVYICPIEDLIEAVSINVNQWKYTT